MSGRQLESHDLSPDSVSLCLSLSLSEAVVRGCSLKDVSLKFRNIHEKTLVLGSLFSTAADRQAEQSLHGMILQEKVKKKMSCIKKS